MRRGLIALALSCPVLLAACGSSSYPDRARNAVSRMQSAIETYDRTHPAGLTQTGAACGRATRGLPAIGSDLSPRSAPASYRTEVNALWNANRLARRGLADCQRAAAGLNYPLMVQAQNELAEADTWIARAKRSGG